MTTTTAPSRRTRSTRPVAQVLEPMSPGQAAVYQRLRAHLAFLRLGAAGEALTAVLDAARDQNLTVIEAMEQLLAVEVEATQVRRLTGRLRFACLPHSWTLSDYDVTAHSQLTELLMMFPQLSDHIQGSSLSRPWTRCASPSETWQG
jgi:IstB-like ATP binding protein